jgi:hypothetical protein
LADRKTALSLKKMKNIFFILGFLLLPSSQGNGTTKPPNQFIYKKYFRRISDQETDNKDKLQIFPKKRMVFKKSVRDLPLDQKYPDWEVENIQNLMTRERNNALLGVAICLIGVGTSHTLGGLPTMVAGYEKLYNSGTIYIDAKKDFYKMKNHNDRLDKNIKFIERCEKHTR